MIVMPFKKRVPESMPSVEQVESELKSINYKKKFRKTLLSTVSILIVVAAIAVLMSTLFFPVVQVVGKSMEPTLNEGDILVLVKSDKVTYGDLCCVSWQNKSLLKRVIGLSGDMIEIDGDGNVFINGALLDEPYVEEKMLGKCEIEFPYKVPENKVFILGDQRETSVDSRSNAIGCVGTDQIVGRVLFKVWSKK
jgi:signal peptidase I